MLSSFSKIQRKLFRRVELINLIQKCIKIINNQNAREVLMNLLIKNEQYCKKAISITSNEENITASVATNGALVRMNLFLGRNDVAYSKIAEIFTRFLMERNNLWENLILECLNKIIQMDEESRNQCLKYCLEILCDMIIVDSQNIRDAVVNVIKLKL